LYKSRHIRVRKARGKASEQACVDCGKPAREWSQTHSTTGQEPEHYQPRCRKCHAAYDQSGEDNSSAKLTEARVRGIRASVGANGRELAEIHGVTQMTISRVLRGKIWRHVK
jgi:NAD-dependent SIR2 family protein deacetylase